MRKNTENISQYSFIELREFVRDFDITASKNIKSWFKKYITSSELEDELTKKILEETYFFSFSSYFTSKNVIEEFEKRHVEILKNLKFENQIKLMTTFYDDININYVKELKIKEGSYTKIKASNNFHFLISEFFNKEKFNVIDEIENKFNFFSNKKINLLNLENNNFMFFYKNDYSRGCTRITLNEKIIKIHYDIMFNPSDEKENYIKSKNVKINFKEIDCLEKELINYKNPNYTEYEETVKEILKKLIIYKTKQFKEKLDSDLTKKESETKRIKI